MSKDIHILELAAYEQPTITESKREDWVEFGESNDYYSFLIDCYTNIDNVSPYTWWDYRGGAFHRDIGYRIDLLLASRETHKSLKRYEVHKDTRHKSWCPEQPKTSDHAPVMIEL